LLLAIQYKQQTELLKLKFQQYNKLPPLLLNRLQLKSKYQVSKLLNRLPSNMALSNMLLREELRILSNSKQMSNKLTNKPATNNISKQLSQLFRMFPSSNSITREIKTLPSSKLVSSKFLKHNIITG
jgi:hypothetical protein